METTALLSEFFNNSQPFAQGHFKFFLMKTYIIWDIPDYDNIYLFYPKYSSSEGIAKDKQLVLGIA